MVAIGKSDRIETIHKMFEENSDSGAEISMQEIKNGLSILSVSKSEKFEMVDDSFVFFRGWFQDHDTKSIILGQRGFCQWLQTSHKPDFTKEYEGCYFATTISNKEIKITNDVFSYLPVIYFSNDDLLVCTDSMYMISHVRKYLKIPCELNKSVMHSRAWTHGLASAVMSNNTLIQGVKLLSPGKYLRIKISKKVFSRKHVLNLHDILEEIPLKRLFSVDFQNYTEAIRDATIKMAQSTMSLLHIDDVLIKFGLSGGLDSRVILAGILQHREKLSKIAIRTNPHPSRKNDYEIVNKLSKIYDFSFNDDEIIEMHQEKFSLEKKEIKDRFALWVLSWMGLFDMTYFRNKYWNHPFVIEMGGHGAETLKGTWTTKNLESLNLKIDKSGTEDEVNESRNRYLSIHSEMQKTLQSGGIDLDEYGSLQWHHLCFRSPIQNGRFIDTSAIAIRPFIQQRLYALSISDINPFKGDKHKIWNLEHSKLNEPTLLHDMLILLNPELAAIDFENSKYNLTDEYIEFRLNELGGKIELDVAENYSIFGTLNGLKNGPPDCFVNIVEHKFEHNMSDLDSIANFMQLVWGNISDPEVKSAFRPAYEMAIDRLSNPDAYVPNAGTAAAKIISLSLID